MTAHGRTSEPAQSESERERCSTCGAPSPALCCPSRHQRGDSRTTERGIANGTYDVQATCAAFIWTIDAQLRAELRSDPRKEIPSRAQIAARLAGQTVRAIQARLDYDEAARARMHGTFIGEWKDAEFGRWVNAVRTIVDAANPTVEIISIHLGCYTHPGLVESGLRGGLQWLSHSLEQIAAGDRWVRIVEPRTLNEFYRDGLILRDLATMEIGHAIAVRGSVVGRPGRPCEIRRSGAGWELWCQE